MGASPLMSIGMRAMSASYASLQVTGHNIANANVDGYSRQEVQLATAKGQFSGAGFYGKGVDVTTVSRTYDQFLTRAATVAKSVAEMDSTRSQRLQLLEDVFPTGEKGLGYSVSSFLNAMVDLAARPGDTATREVVLARTQDIATRFNAAGAQLESLQAGVTADLKTTVEAVNGLAQSLAAVNDKIAAARGLGHAPNDLLDQRDQLLSELSAKVQISTVAADDGSVGVFVAGGQTLVLGARATKMQITQDPLDSSRSAVGLVDGGKLRLLSEDSLGGGSIPALLKFQNKDLVDARNLVGQMAAAVATAANAQHELGLDVKGNYGEPLFDFGDPVVSRAMTNAKDAGGAFVADIQAVSTGKTIDGTVLQATDYLIVADGSGGVSAKTSPGGVTVPTAYDSGTGIYRVGGMEFKFTGTPQAGDQFLLQPLRNAASGMQALLKDPGMLAAASPLVATVKKASDSTASVSSLTMVQKPTTSADITISFGTGVDASGNPVTTYSWPGMTGAPRVWTSDATTLPAEPETVNGARLKLAGVPKPGDEITLKPLDDDYRKSNNGNAMALSALRDATIVGRGVTASGVQTGAIATDAYAALMADIGVRVQTAEAGAKISASVAAQAEVARTEISGVNLDEEAARLIQYQQSYQAAAKVLQVAQSIFETLLQTAAS